MAELGWKDMTPRAGRASWCRPHACAGGRPADRRRPHRADVGTRPQPLRKVRHRGDDGAEGGRDPFIEKEIKGWGDVIAKAGLEKQWRQAAYAAGGQPAEVHSAKSLFFALSCPTVGDDLVHFLDRQRRTPFSFQGPESVRNLAGWAGA
jgi:hypothetical protein